MQTNSGMSDRWARTNAKTSYLKEENHRLKTRLERHKKFGVSGSADEVLKEELRASKVNNVDS